MQSLEIDKYGRVLCISPHPDDDVIGCGGTLSMLSNNGSEIHVAYVTSGEKGNREIPPQQLTAMREAEAIRASKILGVAGCYFLRYPDGNVVESQQEVANSLAQIMSKLQPNVIFAPHSNDKHPDHIASSGALPSALSSCDLKVPEVLYYEVWTQIPTESIDVYSNLEYASFLAKIYAMTQHRTQVLKMDYVGRMVTRGLQRSRELGLSSGTEIFSRKTSEANG